MEDIKLINFINLNLEQKKMILEWRNNPDIKIWMYNQDEIKLENHLSFIENLKNSKDKLYFLLKNENDYIGVIDFTQIIKDESLHMGIYNNPNLKGYGKILLEIIINYAFETLKVKRIFSEVFSKNDKAYKLYKRYKFKEINTKSVNNQEVICMELINDNR